MTDRSARVNLLRELLRGRTVERATGDRIPSEAELCARYREPRNVVRDALALLKEEHRIERRQGQGTFATISRPTHRSARMYFVGDDLDNSVASFETLAVEQIPAPTDAARSLEVLPGSPLVTVQRRTWIDGVPFSLQTSLLPAAHGGWLLERPSPLEWYDALEAAGLHLADADQVVEATIADPYVAELMLVEAGAPILLLERLLRLEDGRPVELGFVRCRGDRLAIHVPTSRVRSQVFEPPTDTRRERDARPGMSA